MTQQEKQLRDKRRRRAKALSNPTPVELPSGKYRCQVTVNGKRISIVDEDPDAAHAKALAIKSELIQKTAPQGSVTLRKAIDDYIESRSEALSPSTIRGYRTIQRTRFQSAMDLNIHQVTPAQWQAYCNTEQCSPKTLKNAWMFVASVIYQTTKQKIDVSLPAVPKRIRAYLDYQQILTFVDAVHGAPCEVPALLALCSLRRSEILGLHWRDIDLEKQLVHVRGAAVLDEDGALVYKDTAKNDTSLRAVPILIPQLSDALSRMIGDPNALLITGAPNVLWRQINSICAEAGLPLVGVHGLRHSFASLAYHLDIPEQIAMEIGGWKDTQTMHSIYTHIAQQDISSRAEKLRDFFATGGKADMDEDPIAKKDAEIAALQRQVEELQTKLNVLDTIQRQFASLLSK